MCDERKDNLDSLSDRELIDAVTYQRDKYSDDQLSRMNNALKQRGYSESAIRRFDRSEEHQKKQEDLEKTSAGNRAKASGEWSNAVMSGLAAGAVFAFARS